MTKTTLTQILKDLQAVGFRVMTRETTPGAYKVRLEHKTIPNTNWADFMHTAHIGYIVAGRWVRLYEVFSFERRA